MKLPSFIALFVFSTAITAAPTPTEKNNIARVAEPELATVTSYEYTKKDALPEDCVNAVARGLTERCGGYEYTRSEEAVGYEYTRSEEAVGYEYTR